MGFEPTTTSLASWDSTTELRPLSYILLEDRFLAPATKAAGIITVLALQVWRCDVACESLQAQSCSTAKAVGLM